ncbi:TonB-dependent receptor domain-containing protein [Hyphobacterium sp.]|uniref:TonB-dependent receptor domain-containing protein n=1 Tax=Hyphobacterium sp. TaxID=2004662 RepID=UPI003BAAFBBB
MFRRSLQLLAVSPLALFATAGLAQAQEAADTETAKALDIVYVTATRTEIPAFTYPGQVSVIDSETIELTDPYTLETLLRQLPGVEAGGGPRRTGQTLTMRGQSRENVTLLLDGARQNFNSAHDGIFFVDPALLSSVEAVRGPASALYGSGASGGVIAFETADADDLLRNGQTLGARATAGYRSVNEEFAVSGAVYGRNGPLDGLAYLSHRQSGDIALGSGNDLPADDQSIASLLKAGLDAAPGVRFEAAWQGFRGEATEPNNGQGNLGIGALNPLVEKDINTDSFRLNGEIAPSGTILDLNVTLFQTTSNVEERETVGGRVVDRELASWGVRADQRFEFQIGAADAAFTVGGEIYEDEQSGFDSTATNNVRGGVPDASTEFAGVFGQLEVTAYQPFGLPGEVVLLPGIRFDDYESSSAIAGNNEDSATSGRFGVSYAPNETFLVFANWAEAFRAPSVNEIYLDGTHFSLPHPILGPPVFITNEFIANPNLRPETTETIEIGAGLAFNDIARPGDRLEIKGSWFETQAEDLINLSVNFAFNPTCFAPPFLPCSAGTTNSSNVASATLQGYEVQLDYESGPFSVNAALSEVDGEDDATGNAVGSLTPVRLFVDGRWRFEERRLTMGARAEFAGEFDKTNTPAEERDGYATLDLYASWQPQEDSPFTVSAGVDNVFDEDYSRVFAGASEAGRSFRIGLSWSGGR